MLTEAHRPGQTGHRAVSAFYHRLRSGPAEAFLTVRALVLSLGPDVQERVDDMTATYLRREETFLTILASKTRLQVVFPPRLDLPDPMGRLLRRGDERYLVIDRPDPLDGHVQEFIRRSYAAARPLLR